jgi:hypothetical protein
MRKIVNSATALSMIAAYANAPTAAKPAAAPQTPATGTPTPAPAEAKKSDRVAPILTPARTDIMPPVGVKATRGSKSQYDFDTLAAPVGDAKFGGSFGIKNKTAKQISSIVSARNRKESNFKQAVNADGSLKFEQNEVKDANGVVVGMTNGKPIMEQIKTFVAYDVDPKTDPDGASVRVWRTK